MTTSCKTTGQIDHSVCAIDKHVRCWSLQRLALYIAINTEIYATKKEFVRNILPLDAQKQFFTVELVRVQLCVFRLRSIPLTCYSISTLTMYVILWRGFYFADHHGLSLRWHALCSGRVLSRSSSGSRLLVRIKLEVSFHLPHHPTLRLLSAIRWGGSRPKASCTWCRIFDAGKKRWWDYTQVSG